MSAVAGAHAHGHGGGDANLHPPPIHYSSRIAPSIVGIFLFIGSEIMLFGSFFTVYFFDRVVNAADQWPPLGPDGNPFERPWFVALVNTCILVTSSFTVHWATVSVKRGHRAGLQAGRDVKVTAPTWDLSHLYAGPSDPELARDLARRNGLELPTGLFSPDGFYAMTDFLSFLAAYDRVCTTLRTPRDFDMQGFLRGWMARAPKPTGSLKVSIDVDPQSFF